MLQEASKIPELPSCYPEPSWIALIPQKDKMAKTLSNNFIFFKVYCQISSLTSLKKLNTYRKPTGACINQVTVFSNKRVTADTTMVCFVGQQSYTRLSSKPSTQELEGAIIKIHKVRRCIITFNHNYTHWWLCFTTQPSITWPPPSFLCGIFACVRTVSTAQRCRIAQIAIKHAVEDTGKCSSIRTALCPGQSALMWS